MSDETDIDAEALAATNAEVSQIKKQITAFRNADDFDPSSLTQGMEIAGLHVRLCSALMDLALVRGDSATAQKWSKEAQNWAQQRSRDAKLAKVDMLRQLQSRVDLNDTRRADFASIAKARRSRKLDS